MNLSRYITCLCFFFCTSVISAQTTPFKEASKWGMKENELVLIKPIYDTIFSFDSTGKVCLACFRTKTSNANKFIKVMVTSYSCNYLNKKNERLFVKTSSNDTCSVFGLAKNSIKQYQNNSNLFVASVKGKKFLLNKDFVQLTFKEYLEIGLCEEPYFYVTQNLTEMETQLSGLINQKEELIIPYAYSEIKVNPNDSLIIACAAGVRDNANDDVFDYSGKRIESSNRHITMATKNFLIHKIYEPKEYYSIYNIKTKEDKQLVADDLLFYEKDEVLIRIKNDWYVYDMLTHEKKPKNKL